MNDGRNEKASQVIAPGHGEASQVIAPGHGDASWHEDPWDGPDAWGNSEFETPPRDVRPPKTSPAIDLLPDNGWWRCLLLI